MLREGESLNDLKAELACLNADLYQMCGTMPLHAFESLCRKIHLIELKIYSFKGGKYGNKKSYE